MFKVSEVTKLINVRAPILPEISCESDHEQALVLIEELINDYDANLMAIEILCNAIVRYEVEAEYFAYFNSRAEAADPAIAMLKILMEQHGLNTADFKNEIGGKSAVFQVLNGHKRLESDHIDRLAIRFGISPALFY